MNTKFYKEFQDKYPTILGSDRNISYTQFLEEMVTELQQQVKLFAIPVVSDSFSAEKLKEAYTDGFSDSRFDFDTENYR